MGVDVEAIVKPLLLKDLRIQCRQRGISPAGSREDLALRLKEHMLQTQDFALRGEDGSIMSGPQTSQLFGQSSAHVGNNYSRAEGQNVGNFLGDRPSSRVLAAPGGKSNFSLGFDSSAPVAPAQPLAPVQTGGSAPAKKSSFLDSMTAKIAAHSGHSPAPAAPPPRAAPAAAAASSPAPPPAAPAVNQSPAKANKVEIGTTQNNYARPSGQNVGNFLTDKPSSRVLAPPGGASNFTFG